MWGLLCFAIFLTMAILLATQSEALLIFDHQLLNLFHQQSTISLSRLSQGLLAAFDLWPSVIWLIVLAMAAARWFDLDAALEIGILGAGVLFFSRYEKIVFLRSRPDPSWQIVPVSGFSFPSAHAMRVSGLIVCALAVGWSFMTSRQRKILGIGGALICLLVGISELLVAANYPSDVIGGICFGSAWALAISALWAMRSHDLEV